MGAISLMEQESIRINDDNNMLMTFLSRVQAV